MHDETAPFETDSPTQPPTDPAPIPTAFQGRTPGRSSAIRAGLVVGSALVVVIGAAVAMGVSPAGSPTVGAPAPVVAANPGNDNGFGPGGLGNQKGDRIGGRGVGPISITAISGSSVSLKTDDGWTRTITVTADTAITRGGATAALGDLTVGDTVRLRQKRNADGTWTVTALAVVLPRSAGTVTAVGADTFTITVRNGTAQTVKTTGGTTYRVGKTDGSRSDVKVGSIIVAVGERASDGSLSATSIQVILPRVAGTVTAVTGDSLTITRRNGTALTIHVGSGTSIGVAGVNNAALSDVKVGMVVAVEGTQRADGSLDATALRAGQPGKGRDGKGPKAAPNASGSPSTTG